jgi:hypothetical protein
MSDMNPHQPTPEFRAALEREIARAFRSETQFRHAQRTRRLGMVIGMAAGAVVMLTVGMILGVRTGYASAEGLDARQRDTTPRSTLDILRTVPVRNALAALTCGSVAARPKVAPIQKGVPVIDLPAAAVRTTETFGAILGLRQAPDGKVLVNDAGRRQLKLLDSALSATTIVMDSSGGASTSYGPRASPLIPFLGDSSLIADWKSRTVSVLDAHGRFARSLALPRSQDIIALSSATSGFDAKGRLVYQGARPQIGPSSPGVPIPMELADSVPIVRVDLESRQTDTVARIARPVMKLTTERGSDGSIATIYTADPLQAVDEWTVLSNGAIAFVRGHDYHIDWLQADGALTSTPKLPFDWRRTTDEQKQKLNDSLRTAQNQLLANGYPFAELTQRSGVSCSSGRDAARVLDDAGGGRSGGRSGGSGGPPPAGALCVETMRTAPPIVGPPLITRPPFPPLAELYRANPLPDYPPPIRARAAMSDLDGNVWILPRVSTISKNGELVYDVVNSKGELFEHVRLPLGRAIAGFGKDGVIYLTAGDMATGFTLERTRLSQGQEARPK